MYSIVGFTGFGSGEPKKTEYDPSKDTTSRRDSAISGNRAATWNEKIDAFVFGIHEPRKRTTPAPAPGTTSPAEGGRAAGHAADRPCGSSRRPG